jgi:hypothetical protein
VQITWEVSVLKTAATRSQAVAPGRYIPLARITGAEILAPQHPVSVQVAKTTIHGRAPQIFAVGVRMIRAAMRADPRLVDGLRAVLPELTLDRAQGPQDSVEEISAGVSPGTAARHLYQVSAAVSAESGEKIFVAAVTNRLGAGREGGSSDLTGTAGERGEDSASPMSPATTEEGLPLVDVPVA